MRAALQTPRQRTALLGAAALALGLGAGGLRLAQRLDPAAERAPRPLLLAPMIGVIEPCIVADAGRSGATAPDAGNHPTGTNPAAAGAALHAACTAPAQGSAAALVDATLAALAPTRAAQPRYALGYTLPVPLLRLWQRDAAAPDGWALDSTLVQRLARTVQGSAHPLVLYLFSTHFESAAPIESVLAQDAANLAATRDGPLPLGRYYDAPIYPWSFARTDNALTARRWQAARAVVEAVCALPAADRAKLRGVTLLGELHHLFPDFESGMGYAPPYRVTDYSPASVAGFQRFVQARWGSLARLNRVLGTDYDRWEAVQPPSRDIRSEPLARFAEHLDGYAHGQLPIAGWAHLPGGARSWVRIYRNGQFVARRPVALSRQDVAAALPALGTAEVGWRFDLDFRALPPGLHRIDVYLESAPGRLAHLGTRQIALMERSQRAPTAQPQHAQPAHGAAPAGLRAHIDEPREHTPAYFYNPLAAEWHAFRAQQVQQYLAHFARVLDGTCLAAVPRYTHQIVPFTNPSWDAQKFAIDPSLVAARALRLGVSLYGEASWGASFAQWQRAHATRAPYGVTEFHPLRALDAPALDAVLQAHARRGADFVSFFAEPRWQGALVPRGHNLFSFSPENPQFGSDALYEAAQEVLRY